jgi:peptide/nickel transport system permease protein
MIKQRTKQSLKKELRTNKAALLGVIVFSTLVFAGVFAPFLAPHDPTTQYTDKTHQAPLGFGGVNMDTKLVDGEIQSVENDNSGTVNHLLGTDANGRDLTSRALYGLRTSLMVAVTAMILSVVVGSTFGLIAGYYGGKVDSGAMRFVDVILAFPSLLMALALFGIMGPLTIAIPDPFASLGLVENRPEAIPFPGTVTLAITAVIWVWIARIARSEAISVKNEEYVTAAKTMGMSDLAIIRKHVLPNSLTPILVLGTVQLATIIILESSLSFLGFSGTTLSLGWDIALGRTYLGSSWWISSVPGVFILAAVMSINFIGDWFRDALDPEIQGEAQ